MSEIEEWIQEAASNLDRIFPRCSPEISAAVVRKAREAFVNDNPRVWWLDLKRPFKSYSSENRRLVDVLPSPADRVWFIPETDEEALPVYDLSPDDVDLIRNNCPLFEYYVVDKLFRWLIIENDHDEFLVCV